MLSTLIRVFASLFAKSERVSGQRPENLKKEKNVFCTFSTDEPLQKECGVRGNIPTGKNICTDSTDERFQKMTKSISR
jgi:hypothetical protein